MAAAGETVDAPVVALGNVAAVVGVGETDYAADHARIRAGHRDRDGYGYAAVAYQRALADSGLRHDEIDGLVVGPTVAYEPMAELLGLDVGWAGQGDAGQAVVLAAMALATGLARCVALVYGNDQRSAGVQYGGSDAMGAAEFRAYAYHAPWGLTSQGALYALVARRYMELHGLTATELAQVAVGQRRFAAMNPNAVMRKPLTVEDYLAAPMIVDPLRLYDYCLVNDGGVAMILTTAERARSLGPHVLISGVGRSDQNRDATNLRPRLLDFYHPAHRRAAAQLWDMTGVGPGDMDAVMVYDSFSVHVPVALEGFGHCAEGEAGRLLGRGATGPGGSVPVNTSGGHLSDSYMQGWNHQAEAVRQLRGRAGERQVPDARYVQYISDAAGKVVSIVYRASS